MRIQILSSGLRDLEAGRRFYERQGEGLGEYRTEEVVVYRVLDCRQDSRQTIMALRTASVPPSP